MPFILMVASVLAVACGGEHRISLRTLTNSDDANASPPSFPNAAIGRAAPALSRQPRGYTGPWQLWNLTAKCIVGELGDYDYVLCPHANVTQKQKGSSWSGFWGILGIFDSWTVVDDDSKGKSYGQQIYNDGTDCGGKARRTTVNYSCSGPWGAYVVKAISEPRTCEYVMTLACPEACEIDWRIGHEGTPPPTPLPTPVLTPTPASTPVAAPAPLPTRTAALPTPSPTPMEVVPPVPAQAEAAAAVESEPSLSPLSSMTASLSGLSAAQLADTLLQVQTLLADLSASVSRLTKEKLTLKDEEVMRKEEGGLKEEGLQVPIVLTAVTLGAPLEVVGLPVHPVEVVHVCEGPVGVPSEGGEGAEAEIEVEYDDGSGQGEDVGSVEKPREEEAEAVMQEVEVAEEVGGMDSQEDAETPVGSAQELKRSKTKNKQKNKGAKAKYA